MTVQAQRLTSTPNLAEAQGFGLAVQLLAEMAEVTNDPVAVDGHAIRQVDANTGAGPCAPCCLGG